MHLTCMKWLEHCRDEYPKHFNDCSVLEMGSLNINGSIRPYFTNCEYIGVDWINGSTVDVVSLAHEVKFKKKFKTIISSSMLEHDPYWKKSLTNMVKLLAQDGGLFLSWGGIGNPPHCLEHSPTGTGFHPLKGSLVFDHLTKVGLYIHEFGHEDSFMHYLGLGDIDLRIAINSINLVAFKNRKYAKTKKLIFKLNEDNR